MGFNLPVDLLYSDSLAFVVCIQEKQFFSQSGSHQMCGDFRDNLLYDPSRALDFFQDWWAKVTHGAKNGGSFFEMLGPSISN